MQAFNLALGASPHSPARRYLAGAGFESALGNNLWSWQLPDGSTDAFIVLDGNWVGGSAGRERDGFDLGRNPVGTDAEGSLADIEILESWFPLLFLERRARPGVDGAGVHRAGGGTQLSFRPHGIDQINGTMFGMRRWMPLQGIAGGSPGSCIEFFVHRPDGTFDELDPNSAGTLVREGESFQMRLPCGGGFGDALDREPASVAADVAAGRFSAEDAARIYGTVLHSDGSVEVDATAAARERLRRDRLDRATTAVCPLRTEHAPLQRDAPAHPLYPGVVQQGPRAYAEESGELLAEAPNHWTDGCPVLEDRRWPDAGPDVVFRTYLDPSSGRALHVEVALAGGPRLSRSTRAAGSRRRGPPRRPPDMYEVLVSGGTVVDGSGRPGFGADVALSGGRIAAIGAGLGPARTAIDAAGLIVCPGFIDVHTHYDAQVLWDPTLSPSPLHGVTTVIAGNCGISLAPVDRSTSDFLVGLLSRVEAIPLEALEAGLELRWETFAQYLAQVQGCAPAINIGFLAGHSAIRRLVMGSAASERTASETEESAMADRLGEAMAAGAMGFSSATASTHRDGSGVPTPPTFADPKELVALAAVCGKFPGTSVESFPNRPPTASPPRTTTS